MRVLVVEDEPIIALHLSTLLLDLGHRPVGPAATLKAALGYLNQQIDIAALDVHLPDGHCFDLAKTLIERGMKVFFMTGADEIAHPHYASHPALFKPFDIGSVEAVLRAVEGHQ